jgi:hypothetical protein
VATSGFFKRWVETYDRILSGEENMTREKIAYVLVNNRIEGNVPLTIQALTNHLEETALL